MHTFSLGQNTTDTWKLQYFSCENISIFSTVFCFAFSIFPSPTSILIPCFTNSALSARYFSSRDCAHWKDWLRDWGCNWEYERTFSAGLSLSRLDFSNCFLSMVPFKNSILVYVLIVSSVFWNHWFCHVSFWPIISNENDIPNSGAHSWVYQSQRSHMSR